LYVAAPSGDVFVIDVAKCNARSTRGCKQRVRKVRDPRGPDVVAVDLATNTVYAADAGTQNNSGNTVTVINGATCNGGNGTGCAKKSREVTVGSQPFGITVDQGTNTIYTANNADGTVSIIDGAMCNARVASGCSRKTRVVQTGGFAGYVAVDQSRHTLFTVNQTDDTMSELNTNTCNGHTHSGCPVRARNERVPWNPPEGYNPGTFTLVPGTGTAYVVNTGGENFLAAISIKRCNALTTAGCRVEKPRVALNLDWPEIDPATDTIYAANAGKPGIVVLNGATCNARTRSHCRPLATIPFPHPQANLGSIDEATHTLYAADRFANTVYAIEIAHCNAHDTSGCSATAPQITVGLFPSPPKLDPATHTLYVADATGTSASPNFNDISVVDAATCNADNTSGCGQTPAKITVGTNTFWIAVSVKSDTVYAAIPGPNLSSDRLWVINGAMCSATVHAGCAHAVVAKAKVGFGPASVTVDDPHHTVYVANWADGDLPGTVSVLNGTTCNGTHTGGCSKPVATVTVGRSPVAMALDARNRDLYVADASLAAVSIIDAARCNATNTSGCSKTAPEKQVGSGPGGVLVNPKQKTVYVTEQGAPGQTAWAIFPASGG
jgi:DNA-binding beta-propeller fold protein YncE